MNIELETCKVAYDMLATNDNSPILWCLSKIWTYLPSSEHKSGLQNLQNGSQVSTFPLNDRVQTNYWGTRVLILLYTEIPLIYILSIQTEWIAWFDSTKIFCLIKSSLVEKQVGGYKKPRAEPWACQQKELVFPPKHDTRKIFSRYRSSHGEMSLQANLIASSEAEVPCTSMKDIFSTLTAEVC